MENQTNKNGEKIAEAVKKIAAFMNLGCRIETKEEESAQSKVLYVSVYIPEDARFLIGRNGQNIKALEHLARAIFLKDAGETRNLVVDVNDYKKSKASLVIDLARKAVTRVRNTQKAEALAPMPAYERRVIHMELASYPDISTESIGEGPQRRVVVKPYP